MSTATTNTAPAARNPPTMPNLGMERYRVMAKNTFEIIAMTTPCVISVVAPMSRLWM